MPGSAKSERRPSKSKFSSSLSFKGLRKSEAASDKRDEPPRAESCVVVVGSTGTGKSSTIARVTGAEVRAGAGPEPVTEACQLYTMCTPGDWSHQPVWVDTVGWEDRLSDNVDIFQDTLRFLNNNGLLRISAIVWCVVPNPRQDATLQRQAEFINEFLPQNIWTNVIIICKQSVNPSRDAAGAVRAAQSFHKTASPRVLGYRYLEDSSLTGDQRRALEDNEDTRRLFNVLTDPEIASVLQAALTSLPAPVRVVFRDQRCVDCGEAGDRRLLSQFCHLDKCRKHPGRLQRVHPGGVEMYHTASDLTSLHPGKLRSPWYLCGMPGVARRWDCCKKSEKTEGCRSVRVCCRKEEGCQKRFACCKRPTDFGRGGSGCELIYTCCRLGPDIDGCEDFCVKCGRKWGSPAGNCFKKCHNLVNIQTD